MSLKFMIFCFFFLLSPSLNFNLYNRIAIRKKRKDQWLENGCFTCMFACFGWSINVFSKINYAKSFEICLKHNFMFIIYLCWNITIIFLKGIKDIEYTQMVVLRAELGLTGLQISEDPSEEKLLFITSLLHFHLSLTIKQFVFFSERIRKRYKKTFSL